jgi:peptidoglycan hydrolase CwlO-like protein
MNEMVLTIILFVAATIITIFGFFLRTAYNDTRKDIELLMNNQTKASEELGKLKGKIELVQQENQLKYQAIQELTQLEIKNLAKHVSELSDAVKELIIKRPKTV